jgi:hypothetical protein
MVFLWFLMETTIYLSYNDPWISTISPRTEICVGSQNAWDAAEGFACTGVVTSSMLKGGGIRRCGKINYLMLV